jgi:sugar-phosphatase
MAGSRLRDAGFPTPRVLVTADDVVHGKPNPEPYWKGAAGLGIAPELCVVFEDSPAGISAARAAGMRVIGLLTTYPPEQLQQAQALVQDFTRIRVDLKGPGNLEIVLS